MANLKHAIPASLRKVEGSRFSYKLMARSRSTSAEQPSEQTRFKRLPEETEDAKLTGSTRSLARRLLGLNLPKVTVKKMLSPDLQVKIA